ncbi:MAG: hypothetical protein FJ317_08085, partial [SAR202 cluster bacterium]|nr:hypothetical protein [SAR202 cluster bacterium]
MLAAERDGRARPGGAAMAIKVTIERHVVPGMQGDVKNLLAALWKLAKEHPGYVSGETLVDAYNPTVVLTISVWDSMASREAWEKSPARKQAIERLNEDL